MIAVQTQEQVSITGHAHAIVARRAGAIGEELESGQHSRTCGPQYSVPGRVQCAGHPSVRRYFGESTLGFHALPGAQEL